ncbi:MAG: redoxin domain-containing protein [Bryobacteraceae bacterium]|nr:redoxin domain-containing protein [Bryobacteraceae bacterium]
MFVFIWTIPSLLSSSDASPALLAADFWRAHAIGTSFGLGVGMVLASFNPVRQWAVIATAASMCLMMLLISGLTAVRQPQLLLPWWHLLFGYAIWLVPFGLILHDAWEEFIGRQRVACPEIQRIAMRSRTSLGVSLDELSRLSPVMVIFLRHMGCPFCREALADLAAVRGQIERDGTRLLLVHMGSEEELVDRLAPGLSDVPRLPDPNQGVYRAFGLRRGRLLDVFGPMVWFRFIESALLRRRGFGVQNDIFQMPGVFMVYHGQVIRSFRHQKISDRPDYRSLADEGSQPEFQGS